MANESVDSKDTPVGKGFSLVMRLEDPSKLPELMRKLDQSETKAAIQFALGSLDYVHYARFLPIWEQGLLLIVTEFDGEPQDYVLDFAAVLDREFSLILSYMAGQPRLPVSRYPDEFWAYVERNTHLGPGDPLRNPDPFSPYPDKSVLDIVGAGRRKTLPPAPQMPAAQVDLRDVQANLLRPFKGRQAMHIGLRFADAVKGRAFVGALLANRAAEDALGVTPDDQPAARDAPACINLGFTHAGLHALGLPPALLQLFPRAYREGPRLRAGRLGDAGDSAALRWRIGGVDASGKPDDVHAMVSLHVRADGGLQDLCKRLRALCDAHGVGQVFEQPAAALDARNTIHFGYRDGISQPRITGVHAELGSGSQAPSPPGDFLLGTGYQNARGGSYIGALPPGLAHNASYAALRVIEQRAGLFESFLSDVARRHRLDRELVAAKLMGRWRDGSPLVSWPDHPAPGASNKTPVQLDDFDYVAPPGSFDDSAGLRCPFGAHIRRLNPRGGMAVGIPWGRRVIRRGMPYGPPYEAAGADSSAERGLVGLFICGDLESQFEFLQHAWANLDLSAQGLRGTIEPFIGARDANTTEFRFRASEAADEITVHVPALTRTVGSLYLLLPGMGGLAWIARAGWNEDHAASGAPLATTTATAEHTNPTTKAATMDSAKFDPTDPLFRADPYRFYAKFRGGAAARKMEPPYDDHYWVFSHAHVKDVCERTEEFQKPGKDRDKALRPFGIAAQFGDGLFFMDPPRHAEVRATMEVLFKDAIAGAKVFALDAAAKLLDGPVKEGRIELVTQFARQLPMQVFMNIMGIPATDIANGVDRWTRDALDGHDKSADPRARLAGGTAAMALRSYFLALAMECPVNQQTASGAITLMAGMKARRACPAGAGTMKPYEIMNTAVNFALGGYLSTEFLITTGVYNLLRHPDQWQLLRADRSLLEKAVHEMLRYDAPFQMADRWVAQDCELGGVKLTRGAKLTVVYGSANRDPDVFDDDPDRFDITRPVTDNNFGFGHGIHYCIGEALARTVAEQGLSALLDRCPSPRFGELGLWTSDPYFRSLSKLGLLLR